jgi:hypothetical protein
MLKLFDKVLQYNYDHGKQFAKTEYTEGDRKLFTNIVRDGATNKDGEPMPPSIQPKIPYKGNPNDQNDKTNYNMTIYYDENDDRTATSFEELREFIPKNSKIKFIFNMKPWFVQKKFGITLSIIQFFVIPRQTVNRNIGFAFSTSEQEINTVKKQIAEEIKKEEAEAEPEEEDEEITVEDEEVPDSDEEEEEEEEEEESEPEPEPEPVKPVKKTVKKAPAKKTARK